MPTQMLDWPPTDTRGVHSPAARHPRCHPAAARHPWCHPPACSNATMVACSIKSRSMKLLKSSLYTLRSGSWNVQMGISKGNCSLLQSFATCERARETMAELAWEIPLERRFSVEKPKRSYSLHLHKWPAMPRLVNAHSFHKEFILLLVCYLFQVISLL